MDILTKSEMYNWDNQTINNFGLPSQVLMENAGKACAEFINKTVNKKTALTIVCGSGNNGGDGFVIARWLKIMGHKVSVFFIGKAKKFSQETMLNFELIKKQNIQVIEINTDEVLSKLAISLAHSTTVVDAIFGIGFAGSPKSLYASVINLINTYNKTVFSVDIPSGLNADTAQSETCIKANYTMAIAALKQGLLYADGLNYCGKIELIKIGIPEYIKQHFAPSAKLITKHNIELPVRNKHYHKGNYGKVAIIAGSSGFTGACLMATTACLKTGAGLVTACFDEKITDIAPRLPFEAMTKTYSPEKDIFKQLKEFLQTQDVILVGCGLGKSELKQKLIIDLLSLNKPLVIDADGINNLTLDLLKKFSEKPVLLTPHLGEFAKLNNISINEIKYNRFSILQNFVNKYKVGILLKSSTTLLKMPNMPIAVNIAGNDGLAKGGSGDCLAGVITSFIAQKLSIYNAAATACYLMGESSQKLSKIKSTAQILPTEIIENLNLRRD